MPDLEVLVVLSRILSDLLGDEGIVLTMTTGRADVPGWDSFSYINFIVGVEAQFGVRFKVAEVESFPDVGAIVRTIQSKGPKLKPSL